MIANLQAPYRLRPFFSDAIEAARHMTYGPRTLHRGAFLELVDRDGWEYAHRFATLGIVVVVAVDHGALLLVEQFRVAQNAAVMTLPGGLVDAQDAVDGGDPFATAAARELIEETGFSAERLTRLGEGPASPGMTTEHIRFYRAEGLCRIGRALGDGDEQLIVHRVPMADLRQFMASRQDAGVQIDVKLWAGLFLAGLSEPGRHSTA
jgi:ADP-ribose pyrophosphatase